MKFSRHFIYPSRVNKILMKHIVLIILICLSSCTEISDFPFQNKVWTYWHDDDFQSAPKLVRQCEQHMRKAAEKVGLEFFRLSRKTVVQYISNFDEKITKVRQRSKQGGLAHEADLIRANLLAQNGGIWVDITGLFYEGFDWLVNIKSEKYRNIITNRFSESPDILLFYFKGYQNTEEHRIQDPKDKNKLILYNQMPGYEIWFIATKKNSELMLQIRDTYSRFTQLDFHELVAIFHNQEIYINSVDDGPYLTFNMAVCYVMQKKQLQLDNQKRLFQTRKTAFDYYKLWSLNADLGPLFWTKDQDWSVNHLIELSKQEYENEGYRLDFFVKTIGTYRHRLQSQINQSQQLIKDHNNTFQQFLESKPSSKQCNQITFLAQDSIMSHILENSDEIKSGEIKPITKLEKSKWLQYCKQYPKQLSWDQFIKKKMFFVGIRSIRGPIYQGKQIAEFDQRELKSYKEILIDFLNGKKINLQYFFIFLTHFSAINIVKLVFLVGFGLIWGKLRKKSCLEHENKPSLRQRIHELGYFLMIVFVGTLSFYKFFMIHYFGFRDDAQSIIFYLIVLYYLQHKIEKKFEKNRVLKTIYQLSYLYINFWTTYMTFCLTRRFKLILCYCSIIIALLGPCMMKLHDRLRVYRQVNNPILKLIKNLREQNAFRIGSVSFVSILYLFPSLRYIAISGHYVISFIPIILSAIVILYSLILLFECIKSKIKLQIFNILVLGWLTWTVYGLFYIVHANIYQPTRRNEWNAFIISQYTILYLQIGSSFLKSHRNLSLLTQQNRMRKAMRMVTEVLIYYGAICYYVYMGYYKDLTWPASSEMEWMMRYYGIVLFILLIGLYIHFKEKWIDQKWQGAQDVQLVKELDEVTIMSSEIMQK